MSGECDDCGNHCLECHCVDEIEVWMQLFFTDGSVSQGTRIPARWLENMKDPRIVDAVEKLLNYLNRRDGYVLIWGAGNIAFGKYAISFLYQESDS